MVKTFMALCAGAMLFAAGSGVCAQDAFKPQLQKITVNGELFYQAGSQNGKTLEIDSAKPVKLEYTFVNKGDAAASSDAMVFVHFDSDGEIAMGGDYKPEVPTSKWAKDKPVTDSKSADFTKLKGKTSPVFIGLYNESDRLDLSNDGFGDDKRLPVGSLKVK